jgi:hypothetical protein
MRGWVWIAAALLSAAACGGEAVTTGAQASDASTQSSASTSSGQGAAGGSGVGGGGGAGQPCDPRCTMGLECCDGICVNKGNDILNCGGCGIACDGAQPFCDNGTCGEPPCGPDTVCDATTFCCGTSCCALGMLCCVVPSGPVGPPQCQPPSSNGTCDPGCPSCVCAAPDTAVATPSGERPIAAIQAGDLVYSVDRGLVVAAAVLRTQQTRVEDHHVVRAVLDSGAVLEISGRHPTADGRLFADLRAGDLLHGRRVVEVTTIAYQHSHTYDILPASDSGSYFASGALVGSTLAPAFVAPPASYAVPR